MVKTTLLAALLLLFATLLALALLNAREAPASSFTRGANVGLAADGGAAD